MNLEKNSETYVSDDELAYLQRMLLAAFLLRKPLFDSPSPISFPDLSYVLSQPELIILSENLVRPVSIEDAPLPIRIMSVEEMKLETEREGDRVYLLFRPAERIGKSVRLSIDVGIATKDPQKHPLGLGGAQVRFEKLAGKWTVVDEPTFFAV